MDPIVISWHKTMADKDWHKNFDWLLTRQRVIQWKSNIPIEWEKYV